MSICLTPEELEELTGKTERGQRRYASQEKELRHLRIPFLRRSDGTLIVLRRHVDPGAPIGPPEPRVEP